MAVPTVKVELGLSAGSGYFTLDSATDGVLDTDLLGDDLGYVWTDVSSYVLNDPGVMVNRGATRNDGPWLRYEAGTAEFSFENHDGRFDPSNTSGPYASAGVTNLRPGLPVRVSGVVSGVPYQLFVGYVTSWLVEYPLAGRTSIATVVAHDATTVLQSFVGPEQNPTGAGDTGGARINRILDNAGWPSGERNVDTSDASFTMQDTSMQSSAWEELQLTADSAGGYLFMDRNGRVNFVSRPGFPRSSSVTFSSSGVPVAEVFTSYDDQQVVNRAKLTVANGSPAQQFDDDTSQALLQIGSNTGTGVRAYERDGLLCEFNSQALDLAAYIVSQWADLQQRVEGVSVTPKQTASDATWSLMMQLDILERVTTTWSTPDSRTNTVDGLVRGIHVTYMDRAWRWEVSTMQAPNTFGDFILDSAVFGRLDVNTLQAF